MSHVPHILPDLSQTYDTLQIGDDSVGTVLKSTSNGVVKVFLQDLVTLGKIKLAAGVDADDAVAMAQHDVLASRITALETLVASDDVNLDEIQEIVDFIKNNEADIAALTTSLNSQIAAVQADVDQNEADSDAAEAALDARATSLEAFETLFKAGISVVADGVDWDVYVDKDLYINSGELLVGNVTMISAGRELKNVASLDAGTDAVVSATGIAHTDALAAKHAMRYKRVLSTDSPDAAFGAVVKTDTFATGITMVVNTPYDAGATLSVGHSGDVTFFGDLSAANLAQAGTYHLPTYKKMSSDIQPRYTISGSPTQGDVEIFLEVSA